MIWLYYFIYDMKLKKHKLLFIFIITNFIIIILCVLPVFRAERGRTVKAVCAALLYKKITQSMLTKFCMLINLLWLHPIMAHLAVCIPQ